MQRAQERNLVSMVTNYQSADQLPVSLLVTCAYMGVVSYERLLDFQSTSYRSLVQVSL
jgi:hypothetical protein